VRRQERQQAQAFGRRRCPPGPKKPYRAVAAAQRNLFSDHFPAGAELCWRVFSKTGAEVEEITPQLMESLAETEAPQVSWPFAMRNLPLPDSSILSWY